MSTLALVTEDGQLSPLEQEAKPVRDAIRASRDFRRLNFERDWHLNMAAAGGNHWIGWDSRARTIRSIKQLDKRYKNRELISEDVITEYRMTALGEFGSDNDLPNLLLQRDDQVSEDFQNTLNRAVKYAWDFEVHADEVLAQIDRFMVDLGTAAARRRYDNTQGPVVADNVPHLDGKPVLDPQMAMQLMQNGPNPAVTMGPVKEGRICWEPLSAFNILVPTGAVHENSMAWEAVIRPELLTVVQERYGSVADGLREDNDISSALGLSTSSPVMQPAAYAVGDGKAGRLKDSVWLIDWYGRPTRRFPQGRTMTFATNDLKLVDYEERLPYQEPDQTWRSGITYFHWWRVTGRFFSRSLTEVLRQSQFQINKRRTQINETIDHSLPYVIVEENSEAKRKGGEAYTMVEIKPGERAPQPVQGVGPGPWMQADVESIREGMVHASGINGPRRGENPANVTTYSQLQLINELDSAKREPVYLERKRSIARLLEDTIYDIRTYWGPAKHLALAGEDNQLEASTFNAMQIPTFFVVEINKGQAKPRSQAAELQKIQDIWQAALASGAVMQAPGPWVQWYKDSLEAAEALELPAEDVEDPAQKADYENHFMRQGVPMPIAYYDVHAIHLPRHRKAQDEAMFTQNMQLWQIIENHCQLHMQAAAAQAAAQMAQMAQQGQVGPGGGSPPRTPGVASPPARR